MLWNVLKSLWILEKHTFQIFKYLLKTTSDDYSKKFNKEFDWGFGMKDPTKDEAVKSKLMPIDDAIKILQVSPQLSVEEIEQRFEKLFSLNDPVKGGSYYLQCKIKGAKLVLMSHLQGDPNAENPEKAEEKSPGEENPKVNVKEEAEAKKE